MQKQLHILLGCADARDLSQIQVDCVREKIESWRAQGKEIQFRVIRAAGSFVSHDVYEDVRQIIFQYTKENVFDGDEVRCFVHIQSHGHLTDDSRKDYVSHVHDMRIVEGSPLNCGMIGASGVGIELEQLLLREQPYVALKGGRGFRVETDGDIRRMLAEVYGHDGYLAGDWVRSIDFLRTHPRAQRARLEQFFAADPALRHLDVSVTAGIQDYAIHGLIRVDGGEPAAPWWDEVQLEIRRRGAEQLEQVRSQAEKQQPLAGLICMADPRATSRMLAASHYLSIKGIDSSHGYLPNTIFNLTGSTFDMPGLPFGPYVIAGFYYSIKHLGLRDQMVMGHDEAQTRRILLKIKRDPLMNLIVQTLGVNLMPINQVDVDVALTAKLART
jgi:hypothetical protein